MQKLYKIKVDISKKYAMPAFEVNTNDLKSIRLSIEVLNGASPLDLSDKTVRIAIRKPDNNIVFQDCEIKDASVGQVEVILENQAYITPGTHTAEIMCYKGSDVVAVSGTFSYKSTKGIMNDEAVESKSEFTAINRTLNEAERILEDLRENGGGAGVDQQARQKIEEVTTQLAEKASKEYVAQEIVKVNTGGTIDLSHKADVEYVDEMNGINDYTTVPIRENGVVVSIEERQGASIISKTTINRNSDGEVISTSKTVNGKTVTSTYNKENGQLVSISKTLGGN